MTMMIMRFNKLIQSKLLWMVFLGIIVVTFVFWGVAGTGGSGQPSSRATDVVATFMDEDITWIEVEKTRKYLKEFAQGQLEADALEDEAYARLAAMIHADQLGIRVPLVAAQNQFLSNFVGEDGEIDDQRIQEFGASIASRGLSIEDAIRYVHQEVTLSEYYQSLGSASLLSSFNLDRFGRRASDELVIDYATIPRTNVSETLTVSDEELNRFFTNNLERFELSESRRIKALIVPVIELTDTSAVTEAEALEVYSANPDRYSRAKPVAEGDTNAVPEVESIPFEEVKESILAELREQLATEEASENAMAFSVKLFPRYGRPAPSVEELAAMEDYASLNLQVSTSDWFRVGDQLPGFQNAPDVIQAAFELVDDEMGRVSDPVAGLTEHYVLILDGVQEPRSPSLEEIVDRVKPAATNFYVNTALDTLASNKIAELDLALETNTNSLEIMKGMGLVVTSTPPAQLMNLSPYGVEWPVGLAHAASIANAGDTVGPVSDYLGNRYFGVLRSRTEKPEDLAQVSETSKERLGMQIMRFGFAPRYQKEFLLAQLDRKYDPSEEEEE